MFCSGTQLRTAGWAQENIRQKFIHTEERKREKNIKDAEKFFCSIGEMSVI